MYLTFTVYTTFPSYLFFLTPPAVSSSEFLAACDGVPLAAVLLSLVLAVLISFCELFPAPAAAFLLPLVASADCGDDDVVVNGYHCLYPQV